MALGRAYLRFLSLRSESWNTIMDPLRVSLYNIQHLVGIEFGIVVTCYHIVEYNVIIIFHVTVSPSAQNSVWRTEQAGGEITVTFLYVINIIVVTHAHSANMIESVVAYVMSAFLYHFIDVRMFTHIVTHHKESGLYPVSVQNVKHPGSDFRNRSVIKGEIHRMVFRIFPEDAFRVDFAQ